MSVKIYLELPDKTSMPASEAIDDWKKLNYGLFIHWGLYAIPAGIWKGKKIPLLGEQIQRHASIPKEEYEALANEFNPIKFDALTMVDMAVKAGMKYIIITAKHHDGFCMYHSKWTDFNIVDATPFNRDPVKELSKACADRGLKMGLYYSNPDWHYEKAIKRNPPNKYAVFEEFTSDHLTYSLNQLEELLTNYGPICEIFFDMGLPTVEDSRRLAEQVHRLQPNCLVSGRVMNNQGDFQTLPDNHLPEDEMDMAWETPCTLYHSWGYKSWIERPPLKDQVKKQLAIYERVNSLGGNLLLNIGPLPDGSILPYEKEVLLKMGEGISDIKTNLPWKNEDVPIFKSKGSYNTLQYNTNIPKIEFYGSFIPNNRNHTLELSYTLTRKEIPLILELDNSKGITRYNFTLQGIDGKGIQFSDGNEINSDKTSNQNQLFSIILKDLLPGEKTLLRIIKNSDQITDSSLWKWKERDLEPPHQGIWCLNKDWTEHRKAMVKYSMIGLEISHYVI